MTKKQFQTALLRGQGRVYAAVTAEPEKYRGILLWACRNEISFDTQCEGTRAWYVYTLIRLYPDPTEFIATAAKHLGQCRSDGSWKIHYYSELLSFFAADGNAAAKAALESKYQQLYAALTGRKRPPRGCFFHQRDDFEQLCITMATDKDAFLRIAADIGRLYRTRPFYSGSDFDLLYDHCGKRYMSALKKAAKTSADIALYLQKQAEYEQTCKMRENKRAPAERKGRLLSMWLAAKGDEQTVLEYANAYLAATKPEQRAEALQAFCRCPYPCDPTPLTEDARSDHAQLRRAAWRALQRVRHPTVRQFAFTELQKDADITEVIPLLTKNYQSCDAALLERLVRSLPVERQDPFDWHGAFLDVLAMADDGLHIPPSLLRHIYETSFCSCCREAALRQMGKCRLLTEDILRECLHDSRDEIRTYAKQCLKRRKV
ncbi:MAG: hypothetical protein IJX64_03200 [Clostridia bacterium]|nr:hypothetical protein [Clostridia bacterium]